MNEETYVEKLIRLFDALRDDEFKGKNTCNGVACKDCPFNVIEKSGDEACIFHTIFKIIEKWSEEHPQEYKASQLKKYKVSKFEYEYLKTFNDVEGRFYFFEDNILMFLLEMGHFEGATGETEVKEYFENCEVE